MNDQLQTILDLVLESAKLDDSDKTAIAKVLKDTRQDLEQQRKAIEAQNRELEIEACLERVRTEAMGMRKPDDLPNVCEVLFKQLQSLGFTELRNAMINIHEDEKGTFVNYDYSDEIGRSITPLFYTIHPVIEKQIKQIRSSPDAFSETVFAGSDLDGWKEFRRRSGEKDDPRIEAANALYYYFYSIGTGSIGISTFQPVADAKLDVLKRFRNVFDFAYRRYMDVVQAETRARDALIEAALERVRAVAMSMRQPSDMIEVCHTISDQLRVLGVNNVRNVQTAIINEEKGTYLNYEYFTEYETSSILEIETKLHPKVQAFIDRIKSAQDAYFTASFEGEELRDWIEYRKQTNQNPDPILEGASSVHYYFQSIGPGALGLSSYAPLREEEIDVFKRFRNVFELAYRRFNDIEQAEAHARESLLELSLERVRARSMAMRHSDELVEAADVFFEQLSSLGIEAIRTGVGIFDEAEKTIQIWSRSHALGKTGSKILGVVPTNANSFFENCFNAWKRNESYYAQEFAGEEVVNYYRAMAGVVSYPEYESYNSFEVFYTIFFAEGSLNVVRTKSLTEEELNIMRRFAGVFGLIYRRFLELRTAEAQARESKIEAALERVRSRTLAMQKSDELTETSFVLFEQLRLLGEVGDQISIGLFDKESGNLEMYATSHGSQWQHSARIEVRRHHVLERLFGAWKEQAKSLVIDLSGNELADYNAFRISLSNAPQAALQNLSQDRWVIHAAYFSEGLLSFSTNERRPKETIQLLERFAGVFDLTYTRFLDLKQAEAQARESKIEAALERVRSRAMAMHDSHDLSATSSAVFAELRRLGIESQRCGVVLLQNGTRRGLVYATVPASASDSLALIGNLHIAGHPEFERQYDHWLRMENFVSTLRGIELSSYYDSIYSQLQVPQARPEIGDREEHGYYFPFSEGWFYSWTKERYAEEQYNVLSRFKAIIELTFRRYLDLQKAEAQTREAQIEASLERVRSRTLAMQKSDELAETAAVLFRQLIALGIAPNRLYIAIIKDENGGAEFWITDEDGSKVSSAFAADLHGNDTFEKMLTGWQNGVTSLTIDMQGEELQQYFRQLNLLNVPFKGGLSQKRRVQTLAYFSKGFIGMASPDEQPEDIVGLLERFAAVFNLTFTRFNDLQLAEAQARQAHLDLLQLQAEKKRAEDALSELRATQAQLLQQEKLASLGQLTAGIAHEIKNPLNFVNNFSSVSVELLDEVEQEINTTAPDLKNKAISQLLADIRTNLTKIIQHGTRADGIVKSMLQHSRGGSGKKEPIDLNALIKEYVNLAFHGMRAGENPINVDIELELDESLGKVSVIAEDFSRVIINLCQNAFDAMREKTISGHTGGTSRSYLPKLTLRTRRESDRVVVDVADNGPGISAVIKDKILQPFFTTKKGTQGTGLGLSITHDIVKAHGGEMAIQSNDSGGVTFEIRLPTDLQK